MNAVFLIVAWILLLAGNVAAADGLLWDDDFAVGDRTDRWEFQPANAAYWRYEYADDGIHMQSAWDSATHYRALRRDTALPDAFILRARFVYRDVFATWSRAGFGLYDPERKEMRCFHVQYSPETKMFRLASMLLADGAAFDTAAGVVESPEQPFTPGAVFDLTLEKKPGDGGYVFSASAGGSAARLEVAAADAARFTRLALTSYVSLGTWQRIALSGPELSDEAFRALPVERGPVAADPDARGAPDYSFETDDDLRAWVPQGTTVARSTDWAADGSHSLRVAVGKLPWHGIAQKVDLRTWRDAEFLELDLRAGTALERLTLLLRGDGLQDALVMFDNLEAGETRHVRFRIADNPMVQHGTNALFQIYTNNDSDERPAVFYVDRIRLTGPGPAARARAAIAANAARQGIALAPDQAGDVAALTAEIRRRHGGLPFLIGVATPLERTPRATPPGGYAGLIEPAEATLELAANEAESLLATAWAEAGVRDIDAAVSGLPAGVTARVFWADDVSIAGTRQKPGRELTALVPDPLLPPAEFKPGAAADNATLLVQLRAGPDAPAGDHTAELALTVNGVRRTLPLRVRVFGFRLPEMSTLGTMFNLWAHDWVNFYRYARYPADAWFHQMGFPDVPHERMTEVVRFLGDYRVGVGGMPTWATALGKVTPEIDKGNGTWDFSTWERTVEACLAHTDDVPLGEISGQAVREGRVDPAGAEQLAKVAAALQQAVAAHPAWKQAGVCFQLKDEVRTRQEREDAVSEGLIVKRHAPDLRLVLVTCCGIPPAADALFDPIDVLVSLNDRLELREMRKHQAAGKRVFWYPCNVVYEPFCNFAIGSQPIAPRMLPVLSHANHVDGVLYWAANLFGAANCDPDRPGRWPDVPWSMEGWPYPPGEGHLYYPGRGGSPWPSLRLENWRDGMEDYEYLTLLAARRDSLPNDARREADRLLALDGIAAAPFDYTLDGAAYRAWRRKLADLVERAADAPAAGRPADLQPIAAVRDMPSEELARHPAIRIRGVVTWSDHNVVLEDESAAIYVNFAFAERLGIWKGGDPPREIEPGVELEIEGTVDPGGFTPLVLPRTLRVLGKRPLPRPRSFDAERLFSGSDDCRRVEVSGVVRSVQEGDHGLSLVVEAAGRPLAAEVSRAAVAADPRRLVDAVVRMTGVALTAFNTRGEFLLPRVHVTTPGDFLVVEPARQAPFDSPRVPLAALGRYRPEPFGGHMIRTEGTVVHALPGQAVFLQDGAGGVRIDTGSSERFVPGDRVEAAGFLDRRGRVASLADALVRKLDGGPPPTPTAIAPDEVVAVNTRSVGAAVMARPGDYEGCLIRFPARLLEAHATHDGGVLALGAGGTAVTALVRPEDFPAFARLRPGSELAVTGIVQTDWPAGPGNPLQQIPHRMHLLVRTAADVVLLRAPSWWTPQRLAIAAGLLALLAAAATAWAVSLRREVRRQTAIAVEEEASRRATALEYEVALRERGRIATDLHDTLLQTLTGIGYQLQFCSSGFEGAVPGEVGEHLGTAERLVSHAARQLRGTVWSLRSMPNVRQPLADAVAALLRLLVEGRKVQVSVDTSGPPCQVHETVARQLLFVVQEAVLNALHHGAAGSVAVALSFAPGAAALEVAVRDDGRGFDVGLQPGPAIGHFGIQGMRDRVESLDGDFEIESTPGGGTTVRARVPHPDRLPADVWAKVGDAERGDA